MELLWGLDSLCSQPRGNREVGISLVAVVPVAPSELSEILIGRDVDVTMEHSVDEELADGHCLRAAVDGSMAKRSWWRVFHRDPALG